MYSRIQEFKNSRTPGELKTTKRRKMEEMEDEFI